MARTSLNRHDKRMTFHPASAPDYLPLPRMRELQLARLRAIAARAFERVALFRQRMEERGLDPDCLRDLSDLARLPFTTKSDLRDTYPFGLFASPMAEVVRLHASSGTTGKPIVVAYTRQDLEVWTSVMVRALAACGLHARRHRAERLRLRPVHRRPGRALRRRGAGRHRDPHFGRQYRPPDHGDEGFRRDGHLLHAQLFPPPDGARRGTGRRYPRAAAARGHLRRRAVDRIHAPPHRKRGRHPGVRHLRPSEIIGPGVAIECDCQNGLHIFEDHFYPEVVDPETGEVLPDGEEGELVLTTLSKQAMPMIRYRTRDITRAAAGPCPCGRTLRRMARIARRSDDMLIIRGVNVFPSQIETALLAVEGTLPHYQIILTRQKGLDAMEVQVEVTPQVFSDEVRALEGLHAPPGGGHRPHPGPARRRARWWRPAPWQRSEGKAKRVIDRRES